MVVRSVLGYGTLHRTRRIAIGFCISFCDHFIFDSSRPEPGSARVRTTRPLAAAVPVPPRPKPRPRRAARGPSRVSSPRSVRRAAQRTAGRPEAGPRSWQIGDRRRWRSRSGPRPVSRCIVRRNHRNVTSRGGDAMGTLGRQSRGRCGLKSSRKYVCVVSTPELPACRGGAESNRNRANPKNRPRDWSVAWVCVRAIRRA